MSVDEQVGKIDLTEWVSSLTRDLQKADEYFIQDEADVHRHQMACTMMLAALYEHLDRIPGLDGTHAPLASLMLAMSDLVEGTVRPLLQNQKKSGGARTLRWEEQLIQSHAVASVEMLTAAGMKEKAAVGFVIEQAELAGIKGFRRKGNLTLSTVRAWKTKADNGSHRDLRTMADESLSIARAQFATDGISWPPRQEEAKERVRRLFNQDLIRIWAGYSSSGQGKG